jgi:hypothetical protein
MNKEEILTLLDARIAGLKLLGALVTWHVSPSIGRTLADVQVQKSEAVAGVAADGAEAKM